MFIGILDLLVLAVVVVAQLRLTFNVKRRLVMWVQLMVEVMFIRVYLDGLVVFFVVNCRYFLVGLRMNALRVGFSRLQVGIVHEYILRDYLHVVLLVILREQNPEMTSAYVDPFVVHVKRVELCTVLLRRQ